MTKSEKMLTEFIQANLELFASLSCKEIGLKSNTSSASLIRFCKHLGYSSLEEMKIEIASSVKSGELVSKIDVIISKEDSVETLVGKTIQHAEVTFQKLTGVLDYELLYDAISAIKDASTVYIYGIGASSLAAIDLLHKLNRVNIKCMYNQDGHMNLEFSVFGTKKDVAIFFSYGGETREVCLAAKQHKKNGCKVISITRNKESTLTKFSDIVLNIPNNESIIRVAAIASKYAMLMMVDFIYLGIIKDNYTQMEKYLLETSDIVKQLK